jgi:hypothetical protein
MARKTIRVDVPRNEPTDLIRLATGIGKQHTKLATASPITDAVVKMSDYITRTNNAAALQQTIEELQAQLQNKVGERDQLLGISEGQNAQSGGTLLFDTLKIRDLLLALNRGNEEALSPWSFNVVVGTAAAPKRKPKTSS